MERETERTDRGRKRKIDWKNERGRERKREGDSEGERGREKDRGEGKRRRK